MNLNKCKKWTKTLICENPVSKKAYKHLNDNYKKELSYISESKYQILLLAAVANLLLTLVPLKVLSLLVIISMCIGKIVTAKLESILSKGLITYLPESWKYALLHRSILDILCDVWFIPSLSLYIKAIVMPMFDKSISPDDVSFLTIFSSVLS